MLLLSMLSAALAATLPGIAVPFKTGENSSWVLADDLPGSLVAAGAKPN